MNTPRRVPIDKVGAGLKSVARKRKDSKDEQEEALASERHKAETERIKQITEDLRAYREMRNDYAKNVFRYLVGYSAFAGAVVICSGWGIGGFTLPVGALTAVVGSTAASAIGLMAIVVTGLFRGKSTGDDPRK